MSIASDKRNHDRNAAEVQAFARTLARLTYRGAQSFATRVANSCDASGETRTLIMAELRARWKKIHGVADDSEVDSESEVA